MIRRLLFVLITMCSLAAWTKDTKWFDKCPKLGTNAWRGLLGWHETVAYSDRKIHIERSRIGEAMSECRAHNWKGYVQYDSSVGRETDSCQFLSTAEDSDAH